MGAFIQLLSSIATEYRNFFFFKVSMFHDNNDWEWLYMFEVVVFYQ